MTQFELTADGAGVMARVTCVETVLEEQNCSQLAITLEFKSSLWYGISYWLEGTLGDVTLDKTVHYAYLGEKNQYYPVEETFYVTVPHEADGTGTAALTLDLKGTTRTGSAGSGWKVKGSCSIPLTPIARASTVGATDAAIGAVSMIAVSRKNSGYCHTLAYSLGGLSGFIAEDGSVSEKMVYCTAAAVPFKVPEAFYYEMTQAKSAPCVITCVTYNGTQQVGLESSCSFTVHTDGAQCAPTLTAQLQDVNPDTLAVTGDASTMVRFCSQVKKTSTAQGLYGATIVEKSEDLVESGPETNVFDFYAVDSRGYETGVSLCMPMVPYVKLTANASCSRRGSTENTAILTVRGSFYSGSFGLVDNALAVTAYADGKEYFMDVEFSGNSYVATCLLEELAYTESHLITVEAVDLLTTVQTQVRLQQGVPVFDWGQRDFAFHVPVTAPRINGISNVAFKAWPIGAVIMTANDVSPAQTIGGTWGKLEDLGIDLFLWQRLQGADLLGTAKLGTFTLGEEV